MPAAAFLATRPPRIEAGGRGTSKLRGIASELRARQTGVARWAAAHRDVLRVGGVGAAAVILVFAVRPLTAALVIALVLVARRLALAELVAGPLKTAKTESPPDSRDPLAGDLRRA